MFTQVWLDFVGADLECNAFFPSTVSVLIDEFQLPAKRVPCFVMGLSSHYHDKFSEKFRDVYQMVLLDLYWTDDRFSKDYIMQLTMSTLVSHVEKIRAQLRQKYGVRYDKIVILGHSTYGFLGLEYAKAYPSHVCGVINVCTPPAFDQDVLQKVQEEYLNANYSSNRAEPPHERLSDYYDYKSAYRLMLSTLSCSNMENNMADFIQWYVSMGPLLWEQSTYWKNIEGCVTKLWDPWAIAVLSEKTAQSTFISRSVNVTMLLHYLNMVTLCNYHNVLDQIGCSILWFIGLYDARVSCYLFDTVRIGKTVKFYYTPAGHWPMFETKQQASEFDQVASDWLVNNFDHIRSIKNDI